MESMNDKSRTVKATLEALIDTGSLTRVLEALEIICYEKGEHLRGIWQDNFTAKLWDRVATKIGLAIVTARSIDGGVVGVPCGGAAQRPWGICEETKRRQTGCRTLVHLL